MNKKLIAFGVFAALLFLCGACKKKNDTAAESMPPMTVDVAEVQEDSVMVYKEYPGRLLATSVVEVVCRVDGTLLSKSYTDGGIVKKGQVLFTIDPTQYQNAVEQMQGTLDNAISAHASAVSASEYNKKQYEAMQKAIKADAVSQMELLQSKSTYEEGLASIKQAEAEIKTARANLQTAQTNLSYCTITAPITGRITTANYQPGQVISGGASPVTLAKMYQNNTFYAEFYVEEPTFYQIAGSNASVVKKGYENIPLKFSEDLKHDYVGKFHYVAPDVNAGTGSMLLQAEIKNDYDELRDGMYVTISLPYQNEPKAILVDDASIGTDQRGKYVYVVNEKNEVVYTPIQIGALVSGNRRVVTQGLKPGQKYVTKALLKVRNGAKVNPVLSKQSQL